MTVGTGTIAFDIGGSHLKAMLFDAAGQQSGERQRVPTPRPSPPAAVVELLAEMAAKLPGYGRISVGFPGSIRNGVIKTAPNLGTPDWAGFDLGGALEARLGAPTRVLNDASVQGYGAIAGRGLECLITLGTGMGFAVFLDGVLAPHMELGQHPARKDMTYDDYVGQAALKKVGAEKWQRHVRRAIDQIETLVGYDLLLVGGGNSKLLTDPLKENVRIVDNKAGLSGGWRLWTLDHDPSKAGLTGGNSPPKRSVAG